MKYPYARKILQVLLGITLTTTIAHATPYASGVRESGGTVTFFLNENADSVKVIFNNGASGTNDLGALAIGQHSFSLTHPTFRIEVLKASGPGYTYTDVNGTNAIKLQVTSGTEQYLNFEQPRGIAINKNAGSPYFGRIYVGNVRSSATADGRQMEPGVYMINPDYTTAHPSGFESYAMRPANWPLEGVGSSTNWLPYELSIDPYDNLYATDWSDNTGNIWVTDAEAEDAGSAVLKLLSSFGSAVFPVGSDNTHGSITATHIEGSLNEDNLTVWTIDEDLQTDKTSTTRNEANSLWRYDVGGESLPYQNDGTKVWTPSGKQGINFSGQTTDMVRSTNGNFYISTLRSVGNESGVAVVAADGTPLWNSWTASQEIRTGVDILFSTRKIAISPDDKYIAVLRSSGFVRIIPLTNGIPDLSQVRTLVPFNTGSTLDGLEFDAAGNLYVANRSTEYVAAFSPGGTTLAVTTSDGDFFVTNPSVGVTVAATTSAINENAGSNAGVFTITRSGSVNAPLTVFYGFSGSATNSVHYSSTGSGSVTIAANQASTNIYITPINNSVAELTETVVLTVTNGPGYSAASPSVATMSILDDDTPEISFDPVAPKKLLEGYATSKVTYQLIRRGLLTPSFTVNLGYTGAAIQGTDFGGPLEIGFNAGASSTNITLTSINDQSYEGDETAVITVVSGTGYNIAAANNSIDAIVVDDETPTGEELFSDDFESDTSAAWRVNYNNPANGFVEFAWDYGVNAGIPPAPGSATTKGLRIRCGNVTLARDAVTLSPLNGNFTGDYRLKFNVWVNYNGPLPDGGPGSTQNFSTGVGTSGEQVVWPDNSSSDGVWFAVTGDGADGFTGGDYNAFMDATKLNDDTGVYAAGVGAPNSGIRDEKNPYYAFWGGVTAPAAQLALYPGQTGVANTGNAGMAWHTMTVTKAGDVITWTIDGMPIASVTNNAISTNVFVGYYDVFATGALSNQPEMSFALVDNLKVETLTPLTSPTLGISRSGNSITLTWSGSYVLQEATVLTGSPSDWSDVAGASSGYNTSSASGNKFYRLRSDN